MIAIGSRRQNSLQRQNGFFTLEHPEDQLAVRQEKESFPSNPNLYSFRDDKEQSDITDF